ncbi:MAG: hypothetical protein JXQ73_31640 [Phycisphaerae bacterium]|nr:hypothetical protein [Phycisphaerae bacterium]
MRKWQITSAGALLSLAVLALSTTGCGEKKKEKVYVIKEQPSKTYIIKRPHKHEIEVEKRHHKHGEKEIEIKKKHGKTEVEVKKKK